jgi:hypothetical protein
MICKNMPFQPGNQKARKAKYQLGARICSGVGIMRAGLATFFPRPP